MVKILNDKYLKNSKHLVSILVFTIISLVVAFLIFLTRNQKLNLNKKAAENNNLPTFATPRGKIKSYGYIVEFKNDPLSKTFKNTVKPEKRDAKTESMMSGAVSLLSFEHKNAKAEILSKLNLKSDQNIVTGEFSYVFNGMALDITADQAEKIKSLPNVKSVQPNYEVKAFLNESVPLINADDVWQFKDAVDRNITGEGVKVAVIDTGTDYTHPDLGASQITERTFEKIDATFTFPVETNPSMISLNANRLAYAADDHSIKIYDFGSRTTTKIPLFSPDLSAIGIILTGDTLFYHAISNLDDGKTSLYVQNIVTGEKKKVADSVFVSSFSFDNGKIVYERLSSDNPPKQKIFMYDIGSGVETALTDGSEMGGIPLINGNTVIYNVSTETRSYIDVILKDISTGTVRHLNLPESGPVLDFKGNKILYAAFDPFNFDFYWNKYYLYDLTSGVNKMVSFDRSAQSSFSPQGEVGMSSYFSNHGRIVDDNLIFFSRNTNSQKIIAYKVDQDKYSIVNLITPSFTFQSLGRKVCFTSLNSKIYCHTFDPAGSYPAPNFFNQKVVSGFNFLENTNDILDDNGHGTHVAATVAGGSMADGSLLKGVAPKTQIVSYKALNYGGLGSMEGIIAAIDMAAKTRTDSDTTNDIDIVSLSLGIDCKYQFGEYTRECGPDDAVSRAIDNLTDVGIVPVIAAGNSGDLGASSICSPGTARKAITVGAVFKDKRIAPFSSMGPVIYNGETSVKPDVVAPGVSICAARLDGSFTEYSNCHGDAKHVLLSGTSMATPHVAGLVALVKQKYPLLTVSEIKSLVKSGTIDLGLGANIQGSGLIDALRTISQSVTITPSPISTPTPTVTIIPTPTVTPGGPTLTPTLTPTPGLCLLKREGDADCNRLINLADFFIWRREFLASFSAAGGRWQADFDGNGMVNIADFIIWRGGFLSSL